MENKDIKDVLNQTYITARDLMIIIPELKYQRALSYIAEARKEMEKKGYFVPDGQIKVALLKVIRKKFGF